jgi:hypothetical protein
MITLNTIYTLDVGSLAPIKVKTIKFTEKGVLCEYLTSWSGRVEELNYEIFEINGINKE